jgi:putative ABC transport system permease protein
MIINAWLNRFAYRVEIAPWIFFLAAILTLTVAIATVSFHTIRTALTNPVEALRYE